MGRGRRCENPYKPYIGDYLDAHVDYLSLTVQGNRKGFTGVLTAHIKDHKTKVFALTFNVEVTVTPTKQLTNTHVHTHTHTCVSVYVWNSCAGQLV